MGDYQWTAQDISDFEAVSMSAPLIITTIALVLYGINLCQAGEYFAVSAKRDHLFTKCWVCVVMIFNSASIFYSVYFEWIYGISAMTPKAVLLRSTVAGPSIVLYSVVVMLVQFFWLSCIKKAMASNPKLSWMTIIPLAFISFVSFGNAIAVGVFTKLDPGPQGSFPTPLVSILLRVVLGLAVGVDVAILIALIVQLTMMKRNTQHHKKTISKLSWILIGTTVMSTAVMLAELLVEMPSPTDGNSPIKIVITFAPLITPVYTFGMLAVLNARSNLWPNKSRAPLDSNGSGGKLVPGLKFTRDTERDSMSKESLEQSMPPPANPEREQVSETSIAPARD